MIDPDLRHTIRSLRSKGMTYAEICNEIGRNIPKGTLSYICKDIALPASYSSRLKHIMQTNAANAREKALVTNAKNLAQRYKLISERATKVALSEQALDFDKKCLAMLYIAEGSKYKSYRGLAMGSSDPDILRLFIGLLIRCYGKKIENFHARIQHRDDQNSLDLTHYWSEELGIPLNVFYKSYSDKRSIGRPTANPSYKGVCVISCSGADIQLELDAIARLYGQNLWGIGAVG